MSRVFYIHNSQYLLNTPFRTFCSELERAFAEELSGSDNPEIKEDFEKLRKVLTDSKISDRSSILYRVYAFFFLVLQS